MRFTWILIFGVIVFTSCTKRVISTNSSVTDSTIIKEVVRFDTLRIKGDTVRITERIECDSITNKPKPFRIRERSGRATALVEVNQAGELTVEAACDSLEKVIQLLDREIFRLRQEKKVVTIIETPSKFKQWIDYTSRILAVLFLLYIGFNVIKNKVV